ncbi:AraC family transcriptional regulator [Sphaerisporangium rufum]|uniref:AraC family transcriptional regulator n=1 Tax=Sphaerisporangium rufum TaxID=1381558 RepID=A0A919R6Q7_9ACTN|nr:AraC family transcriptional regulator [Sphaerisporangium rufum]GII80649.1 AraC family transcriptional regulator [Sphaerisporangium rufum]
MRSSRTVVETPDFSVRVVACGERGPGWGAPEEGGADALVLVHRGMFRVRAGGRPLTADPTMGYVQAPGLDYSFAHPAGGDVCTVIAVAGHLWHTAGDVPAAGPVAVDGRVELAHRLLLRSDRDAADPAERLVRTLAAAGVRRPPRAAGDRTGLARRAREAIVAGDPDSADLVRLSRLLDVSPAHLSRVFRRQVGMTVSRYRNRVRASRALRRLEEGETDLGVLAADLGFADQSHLTRVLRAEIGLPPGRLRALLAGIPESGRHSRELEIVGES